MRAVMEWGRYADLPIQSAPHSVKVTSDFILPKKMCNTLHLLTNGTSFGLPVESATLHSTVRDLLPVVISNATSEGHRWAGESVLAYTDNAAVVAIVNSGRSKDKLAMHLMRCLFFLMARGGIYVEGHAYRREIQCCGRCIIKKPSSPLPSAGTNCRRTPYPNPTLFRLQVETARNQQHPTGCLTSGGGCSLHFFDKRSGKFDPANVQILDSSRYLRYCESTGEQPLPAKESVLCLFRSLRLPWKALVSSYY